jgi:hypothetical protein
MSRSYVNAATALGQRPVAMPVIADQLYDLQQICGIWPIGLMV